ncbi:hypothetical protein PF005_g25819 [Phytophthora fragariae]|uniref:BZIP domain-containing protein n=1 Tax=Phytophthora fragariae TaxID=53985 RepID=A0A6A3S3X1_9STRA|nr:hypothetical protein PF003_g38269 [Phytophthora fragariae]KAE8923384.1 hypothetical protein PF009_g26364 [Phytophthora fragariae]KAE9007931.1 hypothetical protein PF011_g10916 [Phytophthora fragariae]KAE9108373.1 hypothetical protein PF007_g12673 [Phytophthora fragariae]KAE9174530.1 hypothetical protein PF005_g25819 [Phytophthora fragariae]
MTDASFLAEVEDFLVSLDLPTFPTLRSLTSDEIGDESSRIDAVPTPQEAPKSLDSTAAPTNVRKKKFRSEMDAAAKLEMERAKDRKRRSAYRERRKIEKETLQKQAGELSAELAQLQKAKQAKRSLASSAWEMVAKRQLQARLNAEEKQRRLVRAVESQANVIEEFKGFMHERLSIVDDMGEAIYKQKRIRLEPSDAEFYKAFANELDAVHAQTEEMLKAYGLDSADANWDGPRRKWKEEGESGYYVYADKRVMPFDFKHICKFMWQVAQMDHRQEDREYYDGMENSEDTSALKFRVTTRLNSGRTMSILQRAVSRRYLSNGRSVVVWRSFAEGEGIFSGMHADECGWCVSIPLPSSPESRALMRTMMRHVPMHFSTKSAQEADAKQFTGFDFDTGSEDAIEITSRLEKLLLQEK